MKRAQTVEEGKEFLRRIESTEAFRMSTGTGYATLTRLVDAPIHCNRRTTPVHRGVYEPFIGKERFYIVAHDCPVCKERIPFEDRQID